MVKTKLSIIIIFFVKEEEKKSKHFYYWIIKQQTISFSVAFIHIIYSANAIFGTQMLLYWESCVEKRMPSSNFLAKQRKQNPSPSSVFCEQIQEYALVWDSLWFSLSMSQFWGVLPVCSACSVEDSFLLSF